MTTDTVPQWWSGTKPEWRVFETLLSMGKVPGRDFTYDKNTEAVFNFISPPDLAVNVVGMMHSYESGTDGDSVGMLSKQQLLGRGAHLIFIENADLQQDADYYVNEALRYRDHSRMGS